MSHPTSKTGRSSTQLRRLALLTAAIALILGLGLASTASAAPKSLNGFIGEGGGINTGGLFTQPRDVAVYVGVLADPTDDKIFVVEALNNQSSRVQRLDADGNFELMWGKDVVAAGAPGNTGTGYEICTNTITGAQDCQGAPNGTLGGEFVTPQGIAVSEATGHVYVHDRGNRRIQEFDLDGNFIRAWGWDVVQTGGTGDDAAPPINEFEICAVPTECQAGSAGSGPGQLGNAGTGTGSTATTGIAVDPVNGDVFAADVANRRVQQFSSTGSFTAQLGVSGTTGPGEFGTGAPTRIAVDGDHVVYASDSNDSNRILRYDADVDAFLDPLPASLLSGGATVGLEVDPDSGNLLAARDPGTGAVTVDEIQDPGAPLAPGGPPNPALIDTHPFTDESVTGLGYHSTHDNIYLTVPGLLAPPAPSPAFTGCTPLAIAPVCTGLIVLAIPTDPLQAALLQPTDPDITATSVDLSGSIKAAGGVAHYRFQLSSDGGVTWDDVSAKRYVAGAADESVDSSVAGLDPATGYRARIAVRKQTAMMTTSEAFSNEVQFTTDPAAPDVVTLQSAKRRPTRVELRGLVDPNGASTTYQFQWGLAGGPLDNLVPIPPGDAGTGNSLNPVAATLPGLDPDTDYEYQIVATNAVDTTVGDVISFTTPGSLPSLEQISRAYELVSPTYKLSGVGVSGWYGGPPSISRVGVGTYANERFALQGSRGSVLLDGRFAHAMDWALAERTDEGWVSKPAMTRRAYGPQYKTAIGLAGAAADLSLMAWKSNGHQLTIFPEMEGWEEEIAVGGEVLLLRDWAEGKWEVFAPTEPEQGAGLGVGPVTVADDGSATVGSTRTTRGLAGPGDPTNPIWPDLEGGASVYLHQTAEDGLSDTFPGAGTRSLVNVCESGTVVPMAVDVGGVVKQGQQPCGEPFPGRDDRLISPRGGTLGDDLEGVISHDGSRIFFMAPDPSASGGSCQAPTDTCPAQMYVRQRNSDDMIVTKWISRTEVTPANGAAADQDASLMAPVLFEGASKDGDKVFFRTTSPLTADDPNGEGTDPPSGGITTGNPNPNSWDLYAYDLPNGKDADPAGGDLTRISAGPEGNGDCNSPREGGEGVGALRFASEDGSRLYFTCAASLSGVPAPANGTVTEPGGTPATSDQVNLYVYDATEPQRENRWRYVARLPSVSALGKCATIGAEQGASLSNDAGDTTALLVTDRRNCVRGSADGKLIAFWTDGRLTSDDPDDATGDVYVYDAEFDELTRASAPKIPSTSSYTCATGFQCYGDPGIGGPGRELPMLGVAVDPDTPGDKLVYFQSKSSLVAADTDDAYDVYQWRAYADPGGDGQLSLLSTGPHAKDIFYVGNDRSARNVYVATRERLTWQDKDAVLDVYSIRKDGGIPQPPDHEICDPLADSCQAQGGGSEPLPIGSGQQREGNPDAGGRRELALARLSRAARRRAARTGVLLVKIRTTAPGSVKLTARAKLGGRKRTVASARKRASKAGTVKVRLKLNRMARRRLARGAPLRLMLTASAPGARLKRASTTLRRL